MCIRDRVTLAQRASSQCHATACLKPARDAVHSSPMATRNGLVFGVVLVATATAACKKDEQPPVGPGQAISVFTHNLYLGADIMPLISIPSPAAIPDVTATLWAHVQASNFPERAKVLADQIVTGRPDL